MGFFGGSAQDQVDLGALTERVTRLEATVASLQAQLAAVASAASAAGGAVPYAGNAGPLSDGALPPAAEWLGEVRRLKESGKVINAIKVYREHTGVGLKEAKDAVEGML